MHGNPIFAIAHFTLLEASRNRLSWILAGGMVLCILLAEFAGSVAITETLTIKSSTYAATIRMIAVFMLGLFITTSLQREYADKHIMMFLSLPYRRSVYIFGKLTGYLVLAAGISLIIAVVSLLYADAVMSLMWGVAIASELFVIVALCLLCSLTFSSATVSFSIVMAFYILARSLGDIVLLSQSPIMQTGELSFRFVQSMIQWIALLLPDLWNFAGSDRLVYGFAAHEFVSVLVQMIIYVTLLTAAALFDLYRKNL
jgi:ABC-type transport system involved in multi-copper enzyme maturation permease subunit